jgi:hypothetical protein
MMTVQLEAETNDLIKNLASKFSGALGLQTSPKKRVQRNNLQMFTFKATGLE